MAAHKLNVLHFHLTDDQGWRVEIKRFPKLTEVGSWRARTKFGHAGLTAVGGEAARRLLHPGRHPRDRRVRGRAAYHRRPRDRHTGTLAGRHRRVPGTRQHRRHRHGLPSRSGTAGASPRTYSPPLTTPCASTRACSRNCWSCSPSPSSRRSCTSAATNASRTSGGASPTAQARIQELGLGRRGRAAVLVHPALRQAGSPRAGAGSSAGTRSWRAVWRRRRGRLVVARLRGRHRGGPRRPRRRHVPRAAGVSGPPAARGPGRADAHRRTCAPWRTSTASSPFRRSSRRTRRAHVLGTQANVWTEVMEDAARVDYQAFPRLAAFAEVAWRAAARPGGTGLRRLRAADGRPLRAT